MFESVDPKQSFPKLEEAMLKKWQIEKTFKKSIEHRSKKNEYVFYDGPPFATGLPHYGHILAGTMKDVVPRYWTMRGKRVERRFGWDCHGLPVEFEVEKELGLSGRKDIEEKFGVSEFCEYCRSVVTRYTKEWEATVERMGRWVDFKNDYKTMDPQFMESIWWVFNQLWEKDLIYEGYKSMHICPRCVTPLSNFEVTLGYKDVNDLSVTAKFKLKSNPNTFILAWTTTPWTLPGNMALALGANIDYQEFKDSETGETLIAAKEYFKKLQEEAPERYETIKDLKGSQLVGETYEPLFPYFKETEGAKKLWKIFDAEFVNTDEGTGIVHIAGGFGEDDMQLCKANDLPLLLHVEMDGHFTEEVKEWAGEFAKGCDQKIVQYLEANHQVFQKKNYKHSYPHCWRCDSPLLNYATSSWFVRVEQIKEQMLKNNAQIHWVPEHVGMGRFKDWLENARDWCISRNRFWGTPLPLWRSDDGEDVQCIKSIAELEELTGKKVDDLHKHLIDDLTFEKDGKTYRRIPEVLDCWFESGSMPYAQMHYPFENKSTFEQNFPAEFIAEGLDQTRGWFYTLIVLSTALFDKPAFKNVIVNGLVLAEDGKKMSKRLKNYPEPGIIFDKHGADALRFYLMNSPVVKAEPLRFSERGVEEVVKSVILPLWNTYSFFVTYANIDGWEAKNDPEERPENKLDRWILSELQKLLKEVTTHMDAYDLQKATEPITQFITGLTNWYVRRSRRRFWKSENDGDKEQAYQTLHFVLVTLSQILAPFTPHIAEQIYTNLTGEESVHLSDWPKQNSEQIDEALSQEIQLTQQIVTLGHRVRSTKKIKVRQPLKKVQIGLPENCKSIRFEEEVILEELNVKEIEWLDEAKEVAQLEIKPDAKQLGPQYGKAVQEIIRMAKNGDAYLLEDQRIQVGPYTLEVGQAQVGYRGKEGVDVASENGMVVALDTEITPELEAEGLARDLIRSIQDLRKEANYNVDDRIEFSLKGDAAIIEKLDPFLPYVEEETLGTHISNLESFDKNSSLFDEKLFIAIHRKKS